MSKGTAPRSVFISYSHAQKTWMWDRLKPCLEAGGATVLIDSQQFKAGRQVIGQMDATQDHAEVNVLVLTDEYLKSRYCRHEMERAITRDPDFQDGAVLVVRRDDCRLPPQVKRGEPLWIDMRRDTDPGPWDLLLDGCGADLGCLAPDWLNAKDELVQFLRRKESVNFVVGKDVRWAPLIEHVRQSADLDLKVIDLENPTTVSRRGLLTEILHELGVHADLPAKPEDLVEFGRHFRRLPFARLALTHFHFVGHRHEEYGIDLFAALRSLMEQKKLSLLLQSRQPLGSLLPANHPMSTIDVKTTEIRGRP